MTMSAFFRNKNDGSVYEALQWDGKDPEFFSEWAAGVATFDVTGNLHLKFIDGSNPIVPLGYWVKKDGDNLFGMWEPEVFALNFEPIWFAGNPIADQRKGMT
jgi:hypothetical protein